jgi:putative oxidoreductase
MAKQITCENQDWALFIIRVVIGVVFVLHGSQKVFGWFGGQGLDGFANYLSAMNVPAFLSYLAACMELFGGIMIVLGIATEIASLVLVPVMIVAVYLVHWEHGYFIQNNGYEYALNLTFFLIALIIGGPGKYALYDPFKDIKCVR